MPSGPDRTAAIRLLVAWAVLSILGIVGVLQLRLPPGGLSSQGAAQSSTLLLMSVLATPVFVGVVVFIAYHAIFARSSGPVDGPPSRGFLPVQVGWVVVTGAVVFTLAVLGTATLAASDAPVSFAAASAKPLTGPEPAPIRVDVVAQQWYFTYHYPEYGIDTVHLVLPVHRNIELHVTSLDVIHSFWAYELGIKADANPNTDNQVWVATEATGGFHVRCAELCGIWHGNMQDTHGQVVSQSDFDAWVRTQQAAQAH